MPKTVPPGVVDLPFGRFIANAVPDIFDERDLDYRPRLQPLPFEMDHRDDAKAFFVLRQKGQSCTGHAVAAVINTVLSRNWRLNGDPRAKGRRIRSHRVSPYMLYHLARRYDEFPGEEDEGSSLRGAFKGWFHHGVATEPEWPNLEFLPQGGVDDPSFKKLCAETPLGAYYRVNPYRLDDMQSAIAELHAICVSGVIHDGWLKPTVVVNGEETMHVIDRKVNSQSLGGHAFALVGYNRIGFLVQNSWGKEWGKGGFATLPYEDWLDSAYDAWVARPGVPHTPFTSGRRTSTIGTGGALSTAPGPDLNRLRMHVVNLGNDGKLSRDGKFVSSPTQIEEAFQHMELWHDCWQRLGTSRRRVVLYAHGGLTDELGGLETAQSHVNWWLNNQVYPLYFAWQSGPFETVMQQLADMIHARLPFGAFGFDLIEQGDRLAEGICRSLLRFMWDQMKQNARAASKPLSSSGGGFNQPGASLTVDILRRYLKKHGPDSVEVHLVGHSAGAIFQAELLKRLLGAEIPVSTLSLMAPAIRVDEFRRDILPHLGGAKGVGRFATFAMSDQLELDDVCSHKGITPYHKSLLYLVSRAFERALPRERGEVPILGMEKFFGQEQPSGKSLAKEIHDAGGDMIFAPSLSPPNSSSDCRSHGGFGNNSPTMTSIMLRILGKAAVTGAETYQRNAALLAVPGAPPLPGSAGAPRPADAEPLVRMAAVRPAGAPRLTMSAEPQTETPVAPVTETGEVVEIAEAPRSGSPILDALASEGWRLPNHISSPDTPPARRSARK